jgi:hypothetical protein
MVVMEMKTPMRALARDSVRDITSTRPAGPLKTSVKSW